MLQAGALPRLVCPAPETAAEDGKTDGEKVSQPWSKVFIDINGNRELDAVLSAVGVLVAHVGTPEVLIVKSRALHAELVARAAPPRLTASLPAPRAPPPECEEEQSRSAARVAAAVS